MYNLIEDTLEYSNIGKDGEIRFDNISPSETIDKIKEELKFKYPNKNINIQKTNLRPIHTNAPLFYVLILNIIENGIKYNENKIPEIEIRTEKENTGIVLSIKDNGIGIEEKYHEKIFRMFEKLHHDSEYKGSGLGLSTASKIVNILKGKIWLESQEGEGTTVFISFTEQA